jgi:hypothetical protein
MAKQASNSPQYDYVQTINPKGYLSNREITNVSGLYLVKGSKNSIIKNGEKVVTRGGYRVLSQRAVTINKGFNSSFDWVTSSGYKLNMTGCYGTLDFWHEPTQQFLTLQTGLPKTKRAEFTTWWDADELIDKLLFVRGDSNIYEWSGAVAEIASVTANTITKKRYISGTNIAFNDNGATGDTITHAGNGFITAGFEVGDTIVVIGSASNDGEYTIKTVTSGILVLIDDDSLTTEAAGASVAVQEPNGTFGQSRFFTQGTRKVVIDGEEYAYTGGEGTGTLTGVTPSPLAGGVVAGDYAIQAVRTNSPSALSGLKNDLISMLTNNVYIGSLTSRQVWISKNTDFTDFSFSTPRVSGEGFDLTLDSTPTGFAPDEDKMYISAREDDWYKVEEVLSADQSGAVINIDKLKTAVGQAAVSQGAIVNIKNAIAFLSFEPTIDTLGRVELINGVTSKPISDPIKDDVESYNKDNVHGIFFRNELWYTFPSEGIAIMYDIQGQYWNPPLYLSIARWSIMKIDGVDKLCGHSASKNETYILNTGRNDNGSTFDFVAAFGYENYGTRFSPKLFDEIAFEGYMTQNTKLKDTVVYDYKGATDVREFIIDGSDEAIVFSPSTTAFLGSSPLGEEPLGTSADEISDIVKVRCINPTSVIDFYERQRIFSTDEIDSYVEIIAYGENVELSDNLPIFIKK